MDFEKIFRESFDRMLTDKTSTEKAFFDAFYERFLAKVADGRGMERDAVHAVAQGRVWMGGDALEHGLGQEREPRLGAEDLLLQLVDALLEIAQTDRVSAGVHRICRRRRCRFDRCRAGLGGRF